MKGANWRFVAATVLILCTAIFLQARQRNEIFPTRQPLQSFPHQLGAWNGTDVPLEDDTLQVLGHGDFLLRVYSDAKDPNIDLFIAYFPTQRSNETPHSPQHCLPGSGWNPVENKRVQLSMPGHVPFPVNRYIISKDDARQIVLYWFWAHDRGVASEYWAKFYLVADSLRMNRSDGALIRITTAMYPGETADAAEQRLLPFTNSVLPLLDDYIPR